MEKLIEYLHLDSEISLYLWLGFVAGFFVSFIFNTLADWFVYRNHDKRIKFLELFISQCSVINVSSVGESDE